VSTTEPPAVAHPIRRDRSLNDVRAVIPATCYERPPGRAAATLAQAAILHIAPLVGLALTDAWWLVAPLWVLAGLGVAGLFVLGHDASHGALVASARANRVLARLCMIPSAHVEAAWDLGHNRIHHGYTTRQGFDFVWHPLGADDYGQLSALGRLGHRLEWSWAGAGLYFLRNVWWQKMMRFRPEGRRRRPIRADKARLLGAVAMALTAVAVLGWSSAGPAAAVWLPVKLLVVPFLVFVQIIGWTVYVHHVGPDIRWWARQDWNQFKGQMESTTILRFPAIVNRLWFHNIFVHVPHHVDPRIPFHQLPAAATAIASAFPDTVKTDRFSVRGYLRATRCCKLYDFAAGRWSPYPTAGALGRSFTGRS
jgi:omega-6 fatty acid desaturase (delta-12 desaturase)